MAGGKKSARPSKREEEEETEEEPLDPLASYVPASFGWEKEAESSSVSDEYSLLSSSVISYEGGRDESGRYSGSGVAVFKGGEKYNGEFQDGYMHGKGQFKWKDGTKYEGDVQRNAFTGMGTLKWSDGSSYEGEVKNGVRQGKGVFRFGEAPMTYDGSWKAGVREGQGRMDYDEEGLCFYEGEWKNGKRHGKGKMRYESGNIYDGWWECGVKDGKGSMTWLAEKEKYDGEWKKGVPHGFGVYVWYAKEDTEASPWHLRNRYVGMMVDGMREGSGTFYFADGSKYEGEWKANRKHGFGIYYYSNGALYKGRFEDDRMEKEEGEEEEGPGAEINVDLSDLLLLEKDEKNEWQRIRNIISRHISSLRMLYRRFSNFNRAPIAARFSYLVPRSSQRSVAGADSDPHTLPMIQMWNILQLARGVTPSLRLAEASSIVTRKHDSGRELATDSQAPFLPLLFSEFVEGLFRVGAELFSPSHNDECDQLLPLSERINMFMTRGVLPLVRVSPSSAAPMIRGAGEDLAEVTAGSLPTVLSRMDVQDALYESREELFVAFSALLQLDGQSGNLDDSMRQTRAVESVISGVDFLSFLTDKRVIPQRCSYSSALSLFVCDDSQVVASEEQEKKAETEIFKVSEEDSFPAISEGAEAEAEADAEVMKLNEVDASRSDIRNNASFLSSFSESRVDMPDPSKLRINFVDFVERIVHTAITFHEDIPPPPTPSREDEALKEDDKKKKEKKDKKGGKDIKKGKDTKKDRAESPLSVSDKGDQDEKIGRDKKRKEPFLSGSPLPIGAPPSRAAECIRSLFSSYLFPAPTPDSLGEEEAQKGTGEEPFEEK